MKLNRAWRKRLLVLLLLGISFLSITWIIRITIPYRAARVEWEKAQAEARAIGMPVSEEELVAAYTLPPAVPNGADAYTDALEEMANLYYSLPPGLDRDILPFVGKATLHQPTDASVLAAMETYLGVYAQVLPLIKAAAQYEVVRFPLPPLTSPEAQGDHLSSIRDSVKQLALEALYLALKGDEAGAADSVVHAIRAGAALADEPVIMSQLVHAGVEATAVVAMAEVFKLTSPSIETLGKFEVALAPIDGRKSIRKKMEHVGGMRNDYYASLVRFSPHFFESRLYVLYAMLRTPIEEAYHHANGDILKLHAGHIRAAASIYALSKEGWPAAQKEIRKRSDDSDKSLLNYIIDRLRWTAQSGQYLDASAYLARTACAVERYVIAHGVLPETLPSLVPDFLPELPIDPFGGEPLKYRREINGYAIYSLGRNYTDEGGVSRGATFDYNRDGDIVWSITRPDLTKAEN